MFKAYVLLKNGQVISSSMRTTERDEAFNEARKIARHFSLDDVVEYGSRFLP